MCVLIPSSGQAAAATFVIARALQTNLEIVVPAAVNLGAALPGTTLSRQMGTVTVYDTRPINPNVWTVTVSATAFTTGAGSPAQTIPTSRVSYWSGPATRAVGGGNLIPGQPTSAQAQVLTVPRVAFRKTSGNANNRVSWNPTLVIAIPSTAVAGLYQGRVTHSVS
ncbi:hypothetical protein O7626_26930 [Micromonospora sp. WMMD1102]|uniref:hypothetical protein n=1 Tax=Micromonospora sp. WMMD1102 TaxID=3016105 RepID=UPI002414D099|nr:hypothetical protein [Micromonospora sp. WMMD1102]MDG4789514.1 hypothetical protein [Micromonospora sp. WMMD1102]